MKANDGILHTCLSHSQQRLTIYTAWCFYGMQAKYRNMFYFSRDQFHFSWLVRKPIKLLLTYLQINVLITIFGFTLQAKLVSNKHLTQVHLKISSRTLLRKLGFTPDDKVYTWSANCQSSLALKSVPQITNSIARWKKSWSLCNEKTFYAEMHHEVLRCSWIQRIRSSNILIFIYSLSSHHLSGYI